MVSVGIIAGTMLTVFPVVRGAEDAPPRLVKAGHCLSIGSKVLGQKVLPIQGKVTPPRKLRNVQPEYPSREGSVVGRGLWLGEVLIDADGRVREVFAVQEVEFDPPWPEFNDAIPAAIRRWQYVPAVLKGKPAAVCLTVTMDIHWK